MGSNTSKDTNEAKKLHTVQAMTSSAQQPASQAAPENNNIRTIELATSEGPEIISASPFAARIRWLLELPTSKGPTRKEMTSATPQGKRQASPEITHQAPEEGISRLDLAAAEPESSCKLLSLPPEVKNRIYEYVFTVAPTPVKHPRNEVRFLHLRPDTGSEQTASVLSLLSTCREIRKDAAGIFYDQNNIMLTVFGEHNTFAFLATLSKPRLSAIRTLTVLSGSALQSIEVCAKLYELDRLEEVFFYHMPGNDDHVAGRQLVQDLRSSLSGAQQAVRTLPKVKRVLWSVSWSAQLSEEIVEDLSKLESLIDAELPSNSSRTPTKPAKVDKLSTYRRGRPFPDELGRGGTVSSNNPPTLQLVTKRDHEGKALTRELRLNSFFETGPASEVWHRGGSSSLPFGETKYQAQAMSDQINADLNGPPGGFIDLDGPPGGFTGGGRVLGGGRATVPPNEARKLRKDMWALPKLTQEEKDTIMAEVKRKYPDYVPDRKR